MGGGDCARRRAAVREVCRELAAGPGPRGVYLARGHAARGRRARAGRGARLGGVLHGLLRVMKVVEVEVLGGWPRRRV